MKVWIGYETSHDGCNTWRDLEKVFDCEVKALLWSEENPEKQNEYNWREYDEVEVE